MDEEKLQLPRKILDRRFVVDFPSAITELENSLKRFPLRRILYRMLFRGRGLEFDSYRNFEPNEDARNIDWKASLRANTLLARKYIEERDLKVYFLIDVSNSMLFGSFNKLKAEYAAEVVAALSHLILTSQDQVGIIFFNQDLVKFIPPAKGKNHFALLTRFLADPNLYGGEGFDLSKALNFALRVATSKYRVFIIVSDFIGTKTKDQRLFRLAGLNSETIALMVRDPYDNFLPPLNYQLSIQDPYSKDQAILDPGLAQRVYQRVGIMERGVLERMFQKNRIDLLELQTDKKFASPFAVFLKRRSKGVRV